MKIPTRAGEEGKKETDPPGTLPRPPLQCRLPHQSCTRNAGALRVELLF